MVDAASETLARKIKNTGRWLGKAAGLRRLGDILRLKDLSYQPEFFIQLGRYIGDARLV